jgi:type III secretory pathway component EscR
MLTQYPFGAKTTGLIVFLIILILVMLGLGYIVVTIRDALGIRQTPLPTGSIVISVFGPICALYVYDPIRRRLAMYTYISWLKSFEDEHIQPQRRKNRILRFMSMHFRMLLPSWGRRVPRGVTQVSISLLPMYHSENSTTEFPGEIFLE